MRSAAAILLSFSIVAGAFGIVAADEGPGQEAVIGDFHRFGFDDVLTEEDTFPTGNGFVLKRPFLASKLRVDEEYLQQRLGDWETDRPFKFDKNGNVVLPGEDTEFSEFALSDSQSFTMGSLKSVRVVDRPMWISAVQQGDSSVRVDFSDGNTDGQIVYLAKDWLRGKGIFFPLVTHEDGTEIAVTESADELGFLIEVPHFSFVVLTSADIDIKGKQNGVFVPHVGNVVWKNNLKRLEINVTAQISPYEVWVERLWIDAMIPHVGLRGHTWFVATEQSKEYYVVGLNAQQTPTIIVFEKFFPTAEPTYTKGNPASLVFLSTNNSSAGTSVPMVVHLELLAEPELSITIPSPYVIWLNGSWLAQIGRQDPRFEIDGQNATYFRLFGTPNWILVLDGPRTIAIRDGTGMAYDEGWIQVADSTPPRPNPSFHFLPVGYDPVAQAKARPADFQPPESLVLEGLGTSGQVIKITEYAALGVGLEFLSDNGSQPYEIGVWLAEANLNRIHQNLSASLNGPLASREGIPLYRFEYGHVKLPLADSESAWEMNQRGIHTNFGNPLAFGPVQSRLQVPLTRWAGALSLCITLQVCDSGQEVHLQVLENGSRNLPLENVLAEPLGSVQACLEDGSRCPINVSSVSKFAEEHLRGLQNGTFSRYANLTVVATNASGQPVVCAGCDLETDIEHLLVGSRKLALEFEANPGHFKITNTAMMYLGCLEMATFNNSYEPPTQSCPYDPIYPPTDPDVYPRFLPPPYLPDFPPIPPVPPVPPIPPVPPVPPIPPIPPIPPLPPLPPLPPPPPPPQDPTSCIIEDLGMLVSMFEGPLGGYVTYSLPDMSSCWGVGDILDFGEELLPVNLGVATGLLQGVGFESLNYIFNINPASFAAHYPFCVAIVCAQIGTGFAESEFSSEVGQSVFSSEVDIGFVSCDPASLSRAGVDNHGEMHAANNAAFYVTFSPWYCFTRFGGGLGYGGIANNFPITSHLPGSSAARHTPVVVWMWDAIAPWVATHEFGHAAGLEHSDGRCTETAWLSWHPFRPHATHMKFTSDPDTKPECQNVPVWNRHLHADFLPKDEAKAYEEIERWRAEPALVHEP